MNGTISNNAAVADNMRVDIEKNTVGFSRKRGNIGLDCTNADVQSDCIECLEFSVGFAEECKPYIDNLTECIKGISESMQEKDRGFFGFLK